MLALLATLLGGVSSAIPSIIGVFQKKVDYQHDIDMAKLEMDKIELANKLQLDVAKLNADSAETNAVHASDATTLNYKFIGPLSASVRPVLTYFFFILFVTIKISALYVLMKAGVPFTSSLPILWDGDTSAIFGSVVGFYFGGRALEKMGFGAKSGQKP